MARIDVFRAAPEEDEAFLAAFRRERDGGAAPGRRGATTLHRALREDADPRWVAVTRVDAPEPAAYEVIHDEGAVDGDGGVALIAAFEVPEAGDERFRAGWERARAADAAQRGWLGTRLHRSLGPAAVRWVQITRWSSPLMVHRARQHPEVTRAAEGLLPFAAHSALYLVVPFGQAAGEVVPGAP